MKKAVDNQTGFGHTVPMLNTQQTFRGLRPGQRVKFLQYAGRGRNGAEYRPASGRVVMAFETHVVLNIGGKHGTPAVVNDGNYLG